MLNERQDAFGHEIYDYMHDKSHRGSNMEIVEREDGYIEASPGSQMYFSEYRNWPAHNKKAMKYARGRVLDIGCGAGRCSLYLQEKGLDVVGIDNSPLAIKVCQQRGLRNANVLSINQISEKMGVFDTILMMGNNFGLFGSFKGVRRLLKKMNKITSPKGRIIAETSDVYRTDNPDHLSYHELNRKRGRMAGQIKLKVRYRKYSTLWFDYLLVSRTEMENILDGTGWQVEKYIDSQTPSYIAVIGKKKR